MMKKILICNVKMNRPPKASTYRSDDPMMPSADRDVCYPVTAFLEKTLEAGDELEVILLAKMDSTGYYKTNIDICKKELEDVTAMNHASFKSDVIYSPFEENEKTHGDLLLDIIEKVPENANLLVDMTYGPKDLAIVEFAALNFLEDFRGCEIENILYGHTVIVDNEPTESRLCDMASLYYINSLMSKVNCSDSERAVKMLKVLLGR